MEKRFREYIRKEHLISGNPKILLAVSGGVDSMVMLDLFQTLNLKIGVAHCNFGLRGKESDQDADFLLDYTTKHKIPFYLKKFETSKFARQNKLSIQMAARELRYAWFEELRNTCGYKLIATAHHQDDAIESMLLNLIRGTGIHGLAGILPQRGPIIRPMLFAKKQEVLAYAKKTKIPWREDRSNKEVKYKRNRLRNLVLPGLLKKNPTLQKTLGDSLIKFRSAARLLNKYTEEITRKAVRKGSKDTLFINRKVSSLKYARPVLFGILKDYGFNYTQVNHILRSGGSSGKEFYTAKFALLVDRNDWILTRRGPKNNESVLAGINTRSRKTDTGVFTFRKVTGPVKINASSKVAHLDYERLRFPLEIRNWRAGDKFRPLGMTGKKKISDLMIDEKIPVNLKRRVKVLTSGDDIVWVVGIRIDDRYKITSASQKLFIVKYTSYD